VNLGLIITVFFKNGHTPEVRRKWWSVWIVIMVNLNRFSENAAGKKWTSITENNYARQRQTILDSTPEEIIDWY
jgi:hypothetical protein